MIDSHNHILWGVDDGAVDIAESLEIARQFVSEGVTRVAATPHFNAEVGGGPDRAEVETRARQMQSALDEAGISLAVEPGSEIYLTPEVATLIDERRATPLAGGVSVLVECPFDQRPLHLEDTLFHLQLVGYQPVLAHPERYSFVQDDVGSIGEIVRRGVVMQLTAPSLLGEYGPRVRRTAEKLLRQGVYNLAASDRHHPGPARSLEQLHDRLSKMTTTGVADLLLCTNPERVLAGRPPLEVEYRAPERRSLVERLFRRHADES